METYRLENNPGSYNWYINSALQVFIRVPTIKQAIQTVLEDEIAVSSMKNRCLRKLFDIVGSAIENGKKKNSETISLDELRKCLGNEYPTSFGEGMSGDAHSFLNLLQQLFLKESVCDEVLPNAVKDLRIEYEVSSYGEFCELIKGKKPRILIQFKLYLNRFTDSVKTQIYLGGV